MGQLAVRLTVRQAKLDSKLFVGKNHTNLGDGFCQLYLIPFDLSVGATIPTQASVFLCSVVRHTVETGSASLVKTLISMNDIECFVELFLTPATVFVYTAWMGFPGTICVILPISSEILVRNGRGVTPFWVLTSALCRTNLISQPRSIPTEYEGRYAHILGEFGNDSVAEQPHGAADV